MGTTIGIIISQIIAVEVVTVAGTYVLMGKVLTTRGVIIVEVIIIVKIILINQMIIIDV